MLTRRSPLAGLATAACVLAVLLAQQLVGGATAVIATVLYGHSLPIAGTQGDPTLLHNVVFAVGVFFALWLIVPVSAEFRPTRVMLRGLAISAVSTALLFVVTVLVATYASFIGPLGGMTGFDGRSALEGLGDAVLVAGNYFAEGTPLVILAVVLLRIWLRRNARPTDV